jgi:hypothetical protein
MAMSEREQLKGVYKNETWAKKVDNMSDDQVIAVYMRLKAQGKL